MVAEPALQETPLPPVLHALEKAHRPENWQFIRLVPQERYANLSPADLNSIHAACAYRMACKCIITYSSGQTNSVTKHMATYHPDKLREFSKKAKAPRRAKLVNDYSTVGERKPKKRVIEITKDEQEHVNELIALWLARSHRPYNLVHDEGFRNYISYITQTLCGVDVLVPRRRTVSNKVNSVATQLRASLKARLRDTSAYYCVTTDI